MANQTAEKKAPAKVFELVLSYGDQKATNVDIEKLKKLKELLEYLQFVPPGESLREFVESYYVPLAHLRRRSKVSQDAEPEMSEAELKQITQASLMQRGLSPDDINNLMKKFGVDEKVLNKYFGVHMQWQRSVGGNVQTSDAEVAQFLSALKKNAPTGKTHFGEVCLVHTENGPQKFINTSKLLQAKTKDELVESANKCNYSIEIMPNPNGEPLESIGHKELREKAIESCEKKMPCSCAFKPEESGSEQEVVVFVCSPSIEENQLPDEHMIRHYLDMQKTRKAAKNMAASSTRLFNFKWLSTK